MNPWSLTALCLLLAFQAGAAMPLEAARAQATQARSRAAELRGRQTQLNGELNGVAEHIEALKSRAPKGTASGELDASLKRSQELSGALSELARALQAADADVARDDAAWVSALNQSLTELKAKWEAASGRDQRQELVRQLRQLRSERDRARGQGTATGVRAPEAAPSDDPTELMEQADALRDSEDKVRQRIRALQAQIREVKDERDLDRRVGDFLNDQAILDEQDRRLRLAVPPAVGGAADQSSGRNAVGANPGLVPTTGSSTGDHGSGTAGRDESGQAAVVPGHSGEGDDLQSLERQLKQLDSTADQLEQQARQAEARAHSLQ
jgi:phage shock protein A